MTTIGMCGRRDCPMCGTVDVAIAVEAERTASVQEQHLGIYHRLCREVDELLFGAGERLLVPPAGSVVALEELLGLREAWRAAGRTVVWTNGVFDLVHAGHLSSLAAAKAFGDVLVVGLNADASVKRLKGDARPLVAAPERAALVAALRPVDYAVVFEEDTPEAALAALRPDVHCKGADYAPPGGKPIPERELVEGYGGRVEFLPMVDGRSTTDLVTTIQGRA